MNKLTRREFMKHAVRLGAAGAIAIPLYACMVERFWLQVRPVSIRVEGLPASFRGLTIAHFSDIHLGYYYGIKHLRSLVRRVNELRADIICFTGDLVDDGLDLLEESIPLLRELKAPLGKYAVLGNHDCYINPGELTEGLEKGGFTVLSNRNAVIRRNQEQIIIAGVEDVIYGEPDLHGALSQVPGEAFTVLLVHEPDYADYAVSFPVNLQLSGHTHGGQIRLPFVGALITPPQGKKYVDGLYGVESLKVYTSRGIGTTHLPIRLFCRPEIALITLESQGSH